MKIIWLVILKNKFEAPLSYYSELMFLSKKRIIVRIDNVH